MACVDAYTAHPLPSKNDKDKKRKYAEQNDTNESSTALTQSLSCQPVLSKFDLASGKPLTPDYGSPKDGDYSAEWQTVPRRKKAKKIPKSESDNYPSITFSSQSKLQSQIKISDLQNLVLYLLADGSSPQFVSVCHRPQIRKVVVLMVPGLELSMFVPSRRKAKVATSSSPDDYYPIRLHQDKLPENLQQFANIFEYIWPVKTPSDDKYLKLHSPLHAMLTAPVPKTKEEKNWKKEKKGSIPVKDSQGWKNDRVAVTELIHTCDELLEHDYIPHPASYDESEKALSLEHRISAGFSTNHGWVDTLVEKFEDGTVPATEVQPGSITAGREVFSIDCEMCMTGETEYSLTRISLVAWDGSVVLDEFVKPEKPITNYLTQYSGITEDKLQNITTTLADIQRKLLDILNSRTILIGHSLNSDLNALKMTHPYIIDTAIIYPHPRGPPLKSSLKWLAQRYLNREIQKGHGTTGPGAGHDSIEDARTCLDLVKMKCEKGKDWGASENQGENIFKRVARAGIRYKSQDTSVTPDQTQGKSSAAVDWGDPKKGPGAAANFPIGCQSDEEVMKGVIRAAKGDPDGQEIPGGGVDFVWARFRELEAFKGWWNNNRKTCNDLHDVPVTQPITDMSMEAQKEFVIAKDAELINALSPPINLDTSKTEPKVIAEVTRRIAKIYSELPPCTAFIVYSGSGDPREMSRLQTMHTTFKREFKIKKWDQLSIKWTDVEQQALRRAHTTAKNGIGFVGVK